MNPQQQPLFRFTLTYGTFTVLMAVIAAAFFLGAIWTGDGRLGLTGLIPLAVGFISGIIWIIRVL